MKIGFFVLAVVIALLFICFGMGYAFVFLIIRRQDDGGSIDTPRQATSASLITARLNHIFIIMTF